MAKNVYFDPLMGNKGNQMKYRAGVVESHLEENAAHARDILAAKEAGKQPKKGGFLTRLFRKKKS